MYVCTQKETIRERLKEIETLKARIKELEKEIEKLKAKENKKN
jgi:cell division protein FtsB